MSPCFPPWDGWPWPSRRIIREHGYSIAISLGMSHKAWVCNTWKELAALDQFRTWIPSHSSVMIGEVIMLQAPIRKLVRACDCDKVSERGRGLPFVVQNSFVFGFISLLWSQSLSRSIRYLGCHFVRIIWSIRCAFFLSYGFSYLYFGSYPIHKFYSRISNTIIWSILFLSNHQTWIREGSKSSKIYLPIG